LVTGGLPLPALKEQAHINAAARDADDSRDFSKLVRKGRVGFADKPSLGDVYPQGQLHVEDQGSRTVIPQHSRFGLADFTFALAFLSVARRLMGH
jgi:hypothetical protein